ncbi:hypothetical protein [Luteolibacter luteus]|uniref:Uncharacterized protein n=1 Tax=Luteolibacter luteus TaxID=2728835 RepID=A0A858RI23_9BACT|nr:hypothetical protein [Luteolibacter luteus]QJE96231.1 hypothetical protein HHL09_10700 [Luteolibacter luteus]
MTRTFPTGLAAASLIFAASSSADDLKIARTAVLNGTLPSSTNWQVDIQQGGSAAWISTGVVLPGRGIPITLRMDGLPGEAAFRFRRIDTAATLTPTLGAPAWHLSGTTAAEQPLAIQSSPDLNLWTPRELAYSGLDGRYVCALDALSAPRGFFRAQAPAVGIRDASAASHTPLPNYEGAAGFGPIYDDMPQLFKDGFVGALDPAEYHRDGKNAAAAGECYELAGPHGRTTVMITDTTTAPAGTVDAGRSFFDLGPNGFKVLSGGTTDGGFTAGVRLVPAPVTGNLKLFVVPGSNPYYTQLRPYNYRAGVDKVELLNNGATTWIDLPRTPFNTFVFQATTTPLAFPVAVRVTSRFGEVVTFPSIPSMADSQKITGSAQFTTFPDLAPVPEHRLRPVYHDAFTSVPGDIWSSGAYGGAAILAADGSLAYSGSASFRISSFANFAGVTFSNYPGFARPGNGMLKIVISSAAAIPAGQVGMWIHGSNTVGGPQVISPYVLLPALTSGWQVIRLPLEASGAPPIIWGFGISANTSGSLPNVWLDEMEFEVR